MTGEQEHTRGDPRRGRPARYACCAPLATYLLTWPLVMQPSTHTQPLTRWLNTTCHDTTTPANWDTKAERSGRIPRATTATTDPCHQLAMRPATHMHIQLLPQQLKTTHHNATTNTEQPALPCHATSWPNPCMTHPHPAHGTSHHPEHLPG
jgi:hypothetical protein